MIKVYLQDLSPQIEYIGYLYLHKFALLELYKQCIELNDDKVYFTMDVNEQPFDASFSWSRLQKGVKSDAHCTMWDDIHYLTSDVATYRHSFFKNAHTIFTPNFHQATKIHNSEFEYLGDKFVFFPYFIREEDIVPSKVKKKNKCLLHGSIPKSENIYLLRQKVFEYSKKTETIDVLNKKLKLWGVEYIEHLSQYAFVFSVLNGTMNECDPYEPCGNHYLLMKHIETLASGSVMIADEKPAFREMGLVPWEHYIPCSYADFESDTSTKAFLDKVMNLSLDQRNSIVEKGQSVLRERHTAKQRAVQLYDYFKNLN